MRRDSFQSKFAVFGFLVLAVSFLFFSSARAEEQVSIPIPIPLLGDDDQAGLTFNGLSWDATPDISALWSSNQDELSFVIRGDITALYRWKYNQGKVALVNTKNLEEEPDSFLLKGAKERGIITFFSQDDQLYGLDGTNGHLLLFGTDGWWIDGQINWPSVAQTAGLEQIDFDDDSKKPYDFVRTDNLLYCLIPHTIASSLLVSIDLDTQQCLIYDFQGLNDIYAYQGNDLLIRMDSQLNHFDANAQTLTNVFSVYGSFVYDGKQGVLYYESKGALYESTDLVTSRAICTPVMSSIRALVALPHNRLAVYGDEGISIVNAKLNPGMGLRVQDYFTLSNVCELFALANPDVTVEMVNDSLSEDDFFTNENEIDIITQASTADISEYWRKGYLVPLSESAKLKEIVQNYYPPIRDAISYHDTLFAIPLGFGISCYQADEIAYEVAGSPSFPRDMDTFFEQVEQYATYNAYDGAQIHLENILYDLTEQYCAQYATESAPMRFDTPVYRSILARTKKLAQKGISGSLLYFMADSPGYHLPYDLGELGNDNMIPFAFPCFEPDQAPKLQVNLDIFLINPRSTKQEEAMRFLEFAATYPKNILKYTLSSQNHQTPFDITDAQQQVIEFALSRLRREEPANMNDALWLARMNALTGASQILKDKRREITDIGLSFYRANARNMTFQGLGCYDFVENYDKKPYFCSFLYGSMSSDDLIMMLNARAYDNYALAH